MKPVEFIRIGASVSLPTMYNLEDEYFLRMSSIYDPDQITRYPTTENGNPLDVLISEYKVISPLKSNGSIGFQFGKVGLLSADIEYINYASMRLRDGSEGYDFYAENSEITDAFRDVFNLRTGGELRFGPLALRGGFAYFPSPYKDGELNEDYKHMEISGGIGVRQSNFFIDIGTVYQMHEEKFNLYNDPDGSNIADIDQNKLRFVSTIGFRF
ncbi:MAG: hypothetical protein HC906_05940 [Bacteroidales bacterium]|nr:hypothetical protein [Bacteroidales bacterium]